MKVAGYDVRESDPFDTESPVTFESREKSPYINRIKIMWHEMREKVISVFPESPVFPRKLEKYLDQIDEIYATDAYHSLSIERYKVTPELIDKGVYDKMHFSLN